MQRVHHTHWGAADGDAHTEKSKSTPQHCVTSAASASGSCLSNPFHTATTKQSLPLTIATIAGRGHYRLESEQEIEAEAIRSRRKSKV